MSYRRGHPLYAKLFLEIISKAQGVPVLPSAEKEEDMMYKRKVVQYTMEGKPVKLYSSIREAEKKYGISHISMVCKGKRHSDGGYIWRYLEDVI